MLVIPLYGIPHSAWALMDGLQSGRIKVPLREFRHEVVGVEDHLAFAACVAGWGITLSLLTLWGFVAARELFRRHKH